jgi:Holliday junction DNA helicase RuvA
VIIRLVGTLALTGRDYALIDVQGVGYQVFMADRALAQLPATGQAITVFTHLAHREDAMLLYGFPSLEERELFLMLTSVSGVGTKTALGILSLLSPEEVVSAIANSDARGLARAPGVGKKTAERLILELKEKLTAKRSTFKASAEAGPLGHVAPELQEAELALLSLGFEPDEISRTLTRLPAGTAVEDAIRTAIQTLSEV